MPRRFQTFRWLQGLCRSVAGAAGFGLFLLGPVSALAAGQTREIADDAALKAALVQGVAGDILVLAPGRYGPLDLHGTRNEVPAAITSADPNHPAEIVGIKARDFDGLHLSHLLLRYHFAEGDKIHQRAFAFRDCQDLVITDSRIQGDEARGVSPVEDGRPFGVGIGINNCTDVALRKLHISDFHRGMILRGVDGGDIRGNEITSMRSDGMNFVQVTDLRIEDNRIHSFRRAPGAGDHADMIQFWTNKTTRPSERITIRGNVLHSGRARATQSIFMRNEEVDRGRAGPEMFYRDITIEQNVIINAHLHGITVGETDGLTIRNNTLIHNPLSAGKDPGRKLWVPRINVAQKSQDVEISHNIATKNPKYADREDWAVHSNLHIQDDHRAKPGFYGHVFLGMPGGDPLQLETYTYRPDGQASAPDLGAAMLRR